MHIRVFEKWLARVTGVCLVVLLAVLAAAKPWSGRDAARMPGWNSAEMEPVLVELLGRVYTAFGQAEEFAIYDGIASAVAEDLVTSLYLQRRAAQLLEEEAGAETEILDLELKEMTAKGRNAAGYIVAARWQVSGRVGHSDHQHIRVNEYAAELTLGPVTGGWQFTGFDLDTVARQEPEPMFFEGFE